MIDTKALKEKVLDLAIRGKLVPQDPNDEPASVLLERIREQKQQMVKEGKLKAKDINNDTIIFKGDDNLHYEKFQDGTVNCIEDEIPFAIPNNWKWCRLGYIGTWQSGATPSRNHPEYFGGNIPWLKTGDLNDGLINSVSEYITQDGVNNSSVVLNPIGSVLIAMYGATIGKLGITNIELTTNQACCACLPLEGINNLYLFYFLLSQREKFILRGTGGAQPNISKEKIVSTLFPVPPYLEQIRIINNIEYLMKYIATIELNKGDLYNLIKVIKSKILDLAIRGQLVPQDPNDEPASVLLERIRSEKEELIKQGKIKRDKKESIIFRGEDNSYYETILGNTTCIKGEIPYEIPESWNWVRLGFLAQYKKGPFGSSLTKAMFVPDSASAIKVYEQKNAIQKDASLGDYYISEEKYESLKSFEVFPDDIIVSCAGTIGETFVLPCNMRKGIINQALMKISLYDISILDFYLIYFDFQLKKNANEQGYGVALKNIPPFDILKNYLVPIPPINEQRRIIDAVKSYFDLIEIVSDNI